MAENKFGDPTLRHGGQADRRSDLGVPFETAPTETHIPGKFLPGKEPRFQSVAGRGGGNPPAGELSDAQRERNQMIQEMMARGEYEPLVRIPRIMSLNALLAIIDFFESQKGPFRYNYEARQVDPAMEKVGDETRRKEMKAVYEAASAINDAWLAKEQSAGSFAFAGDGAPKISPENNEYFRMIPGVKEATWVYINDRNGGLAEFLANQPTDGTPRGTGGGPVNILPYTTRYAEGQKTTEGTNAIRNIVRYSTFLALARKYFQIAPQIDEAQLVVVEQNVTMAHSTPEDQTFAFRNELLRREARLQAQSEDVYSRMPNYGEQRDYELAELGIIVDSQEEKLLELYEQLAEARRENDDSWKTEISKQMEEMFAEKFEKQKGKVNIYQKLARLQQGFSKGEIPADEKGINWGHELYLLSERSQRKAERLLEAEGVFDRLNPGLSKVLNPRGDLADLMFGERRRVFKKGNQDVGVYDTLDKIFSDDPKNNPLICTRAHPDWGQYASDLLHFYRSSVTGRTAWEYLIQGKEPPWKEMEDPAEGSWHFFINMMGVAGKDGFYGGYICQKEDFWNNPELLKGKLRSETFLLDLQQRVNWFINVACPVTAEVVAKNGLEAKTIGSKDSDRYWLDKNGMIIDTHTLRSSPGQPMPEGEITRLGLRSTEDVKHGLKFLIILGGVAAASASWLRPVNFGEQETLIAKDEIDKIIKFLTKPGYRKIIGNSSVVTPEAYLDESRLKRVGHSVKELTKYGVTM